MDNLTRTTATIVRTSIGLPAPEDQAAVFVVTYDHHRIGATRVSHVPLNPESLAKFMKICGVERMENVAGAEVLALAVTKGGRVVGFESSSRRHRMVWGEQSVGVTMVDQSELEQLRDENAYLRRDLNLARDHRERMLAQLASSNSPDLAPIVQALAPGEINLSLGEIVERATAYRMHSVALHSVEQILQAKAPTLDPLPVASSGAHIPELAVSIIEAFQATSRIMGALRMRLTSGKGEG